MKVLVGVKRVVDYAVKVRVNKGNVELANVKQSMNPFCEVGYDVEDRLETSAFRVSITHPMSRCFQRLPWKKPSA